MHAVGCYLRYCHLHPKSQSQELLLSWFVAQLRAGGHNAGAKERKGGHPVALTTSSKDLSIPFPILSCCAVRTVVGDEATVPLQARLT